MARMLGKAAWDGLFCHCCNDRRSNHHQRQREAQEWRREITREEYDRLVDAEIERWRPALDLMAAWPTEE